MLWNWYTVDACFLSTSWHVTSPGMFAGTCIGVMGLVVTLELLRRAAKEYDHRLLRGFQELPGASATAQLEESNDSSRKLGAVREFRPTAVQQAVRAALHMLQFAVAYMVMLLAMYYNGYIIICIFIGAFIGFFIFGWETMSLG
jgi:copper transporter 1